MIPTIAAILLAWAALSIAFAPMAGSVIAQRLRGKS